MKGAFRSSIRISGRALGYWGSQSISSDPSAVFELVKNAKDADATYVEIAFENAGRKDGRITVRDDGDGMTREAIDKAWMVAGTDSRRRNRVSGRGRQVLGEMGIGRFSCERLAGMTTMRSYPRGGGDMVVMEFDWKEYEAQGVTMDQVLHEGRVEPKDDPGRHGLELVLEGLKSEWDRSKIESLSKELQRYILPRGIGGERDFAVRITVDGKDFAGKEGIRSSLLKIAPLKMAAKYDGQKIALKIADQMDGTAKNPDMEPIDVGEKSCGPFELRLHFYPWDKGGEHKWKGYYDRVLKAAAVKEFLEQHSGVYLYRDGAWVKPYGARNDWLNLEGRRVQRRTKMGLTQVYCRVDITHDGNRGIRPTAHREVLQNNEALADLKKLIIDSVAELEKYRDRLPGRSGDVKPTARPRKMVANNIKQIRLACRNKETLSGQEISRIDALAKAAEAQNKDAERDSTDEDEEGREVARHELSILSIGLLASYMSREIASSLKSTADVLSSARRMMETADFARPLPGEAVEKLRGWLESLEADSGRITRFASYVNEMSSHLAGERPEGRQDPQIRIADMWRGVVDGVSVSTKLPDAKIDLAPDPDDLSVRFSGLDVRSVLSHLVANAVESIKKAGGPRQIIRLDASHGRTHLVMSISDTGTGITIDKDRIFDPFVTTSRGGGGGASGQGLGLSIARRILEQSESTIEAASPGKPGYSTTFTVKIPTKYAIRVHKAEAEATSRAKTPARRAK